MQKAADADSRTDILDLLHHDHEEAKDLFEKICEGLDEESLAATFDELRAALLMHAEAEEKCLYGRLLKEDDESRFFALKADVEHGLAETLLEQLHASAEKGSDEWLAQCIVLKELVEHHIDEEEGEGFEIAREIFDDEALAKLGAEFEREKQRLAKT
jgi:hemerythrin superfamily protein